MEEAAIRLQVERARAGEREALDELFRAHRADLLRLCTRMLGPVDAEDSANEVFQRVQLRLSSYDSDRPFRPWLLSIAAHHCVDVLRRRNVEQRIFDPSEADTDDFAGGAHSALDALVQDRRQAAVRDALDGLPERYRAPLVLRYFAELDYDAIAEELGLSRSQVASLLFRGKQRLRERLRGRQEAGS